MTKEAPVVCVVPLCEIHCALVSKRVSHNDHCAHNEKCRCVKLATLKQKGSSAVKRLW